MADNISRIKVLITELKNIQRTLQQSLSNPDNGPLAGMDVKLSIIRCQLIQEKANTDDMNIIVDLATYLINYIKDPLVSDPFYTALKVKLGNCSPDLRTHYIATILEVMKRPSLKLSVS